MPLLVFLLKFTPIKVGSTKKTLLLIIKALKDTKILMNFKLVFVFEQKILDFRVIPGNKINMDMKFNPTP